MVWQRNKSAINTQMHVCTHTHAHKKHILHIASILICDGKVRRVNCLHFKDRRLEGVNDENISNAKPLPGMRGELRLFSVAS